MKMLLLIILFTLTCNNLFGFVFFTKDEFKYTADYTSVNFTAVPSLNIAFKGIDVVYIQPHFGFEYEIGWFDSADSVKDNPDKSRNFAVDLFLGTSYLTIKKDNKDTTPLDVVKSSTFDFGIYFKKYLIDNNFSFVGGALYSFSYEAENTFVIVLGFGLSI